MSFINGSSVKNPIETGSLNNTVVGKSTSLFKPVNMFRLSLLSVGLTQVLNSRRSRKKFDHNAVKFSCGLNFRYSRFISYLSRFTAKDFCIWRLMEYTSITIHGTVFFYQITIHRAQKRRITASRKYPYPHARLRKKLLKSALSVYVFC